MKRNSEPSSGQKGATKDDAWTKGYQRAVEQSRDLPIRDRYQEAVCVALVFICKKLARSTDDEQQIGYIEGLFAK